MTGKSVVGIINCPPDISKSTIAAADSRSEPRQRSLDGTGHRLRFVKLNRVPAVRNHDLLLFFESCGIRSYSVRWSFGTGRNERGMVAKQGTASSHNAKIFAPGRITLSLKFQNSAIGCTARVAPGNPVGEGARPRPIERLGLGGNPSLAEGRTTDSG
jgi:hypothetical protein